MTAAATPAPAAPTTLERITARQQVEAWIAEFFEQNPDAEGVLPDWLAELSEHADEDLATKIKRIGYRILTLKGETEAIDAELARLGARKATRVNATDRLKRLVTIALSELGTKKVEDATITVCLQKNGGLAPLSFAGGEDQVRSLPSHLLRISYEPNMAKAREVLASGGTLPEGFVQGERGESVRVR